MDHPRVRAFPSTGSSHTASAQGPETGRNFTKDVKIVGTNSVKSFRINKSVKKTNSKMREIMRENVLKMRKTGQNGAKKRPHKG